ncbi:LPXTG cell wall anchor domain-containing protein [Streptococcus dentasini]
MKVKKIIYGSLAVLALFSAGYTSYATWSGSPVYAEEAQSQNPNIQSFPSGLVGTWQNQMTDANGQTLTTTITVNEDGSFTTDFVSADGQKTTKSGNINNVEQNGVASYKFIDGSNTMYFGFNDSDYAGVSDQSTVGFVLESGVLYPQIWQSGNETALSYDRPFSKVNAKQNQGKEAEEEMAFPSELVGTWSGTYQGDTTFTMTTEITKDGHVTKTKEYADGTVDKTEFTINKVKKVGDGLYVLVDATGYFSEISDLSSLGGKVETGFLLKDGVFQPAFWRVPSENTGIDYSSPTLGGQYTKVDANKKQNNSSSTSSNSSSSSTATQSQTSAATDKKEDKQDKKNGNLPSTGEAVSILGILGVALLALAGYLMLKKKK